VVLATVVIVWAGACDVVSELDGYQVEGRRPSGDGGEGGSAGLGGNSSGTGGVGGVNPEAGGGGATAPPLAQVSCRGVECLPGQVCCFDADDEEQIGCATACEREEIAIACDGPEDCAPEHYCCGRFSPPNDYTLVALDCVTTCEDIYAWTYCHGTEDCIYAEETCGPDEDLGTPYQYCAIPAS
jgi:hypothetical protein